MQCLQVKNALALGMVVRSRCEVLKASVNALVFGMYVVNNCNCRGFVPLLDDKLCLIFNFTMIGRRTTFTIFPYLLLFFFFLKSTQPPPIPLPPPPAFFRF